MQGPLLLLCRIRWVSYNPFFVIFFLIGFKATSNHFQVTSQYLDDIELVALEVFYDHLQPRVHDLLVN